jgi:hypothetical protein
VDRRAEVAAAARRVRRSATPPDARDLGEQQEVDRSAGRKWRNGWPCSSGWSEYGRPCDELVAYRAGLDEQEAKRGEGDDLATTAGELAEAFASCGPLPANSARRGQRWPEAGLRDAEAVGRPEPWRTRADAVLE